MHSGRLADPLDPVTRNIARLAAKRPKTEADHRALARAEFYGGLWLHLDRPCIPAEALAATFCAAAKNSRRAYQAMAGLAVEENAALLYDGPTDVDELWKSGQFSLRVGVKIRSVRTMRTRPCFQDWSAEFTATFLPSLLDRDLVIQTYVAAGVREGLGDWRPTNGTFSVEVLD